MNNVDLIRSFKEVLPKEYIQTELLQRIAWGTDAGFYNLIPQIVLFPDTEQQVANIIRIAHKHKKPITFRAAGTSLSGQAITDSILVVVGKKWEKYTIDIHNKTISLQPGIVGQQVNEILAPLGYKFAPDPASIKSAMVGGIIMNNASGMNCGIHANSDQELRSARIILADGYILNTADSKSREGFSLRYPDFINRLLSIQKDIQRNPSVLEKLKEKYKIKNVTGLNLLPFIQYDDPFDLITHLLVGSEGTLAFLSEATLRIRKIQPYKASAFLLFKDIYTACQTVLAIKQGPVIGAELLDYTSLKAIQQQEGIPHLIRNPKEGTTALLVETAAETKEELYSHIETIRHMIPSSGLLHPAHFTDDPEEYNIYWKIRSGIFPSVGSWREVGTTCIIEDVAFPLHHLPEASVDLQQIIQKYGYKDGAIYGHALEGNLHFIINQKFDTPADIQNYDLFIREVAQLVVKKYNGSLKAEHGTGRNMAPFVSYEWGDEISSIMKQVKELFDPCSILNSGVIFNDNKECHIQNLKTFTLTHPLIDKCIECGFCEINCLTSGLTLSSRQRIVIQREIERLKKGALHPTELKKLEKRFYNYGIASCAGDGLCTQSCPMGINVGELTHYIRQEKLKHSSIAPSIAHYTGSHLSGLEQGLRSILLLANTGHTLLGTPIMKGIAQAIHQLSYHTFPLWTPAFPRPYWRKKKYKMISQTEKVVYFPSCINQTMGLPLRSKESKPLIDETIELLQKGGYEVVFPDNYHHLCCGTIWESKGAPDVADQKIRELEQALWISSEEGRWPVLCDQSPCLYRMKKHITKIRLYEPVEFIHHYLKDKLVFKPIQEPISIHITCSTSKMGLKDIFKEVAGLCTTEVNIPSEVGCCGFAGDKGFTHPQINKYALRKLKPQIESKGIQRGYSNSRTCEIGLTTHSGIEYSSIVYLVNQCSQPKP